MSWKYILKFANLCNQVYNPSLHGIKLDWIEEDGYRAILLKDDIDQEVILTVRGTYNFSCFVNDLEMVLGVLPSYKKYIEKSLKNAVKISKNLGYSIMCTGHSLGGSLCQYMSATHNVPSINFNPYGIKRLLDIKEFDDSIITNYVMEKDIVSWMSRKNQIGRVIPLEIPEPLKRVFSERSYYPINPHSTRTIVQVLAFLAKQEENEGRQINSILKECIVE